MTDEEQAKMLVDRIKLTMTRHKEITLMGKAAKQQANIKKKVKQRKINKALLNESFKNKLSEMLDDELYTLQDSEGNYLPGGYPLKLEGRKWKAYFKLDNNG